MFSNISYSSQLRTVRRFKVSDGDTQRFNCPFCNGYNTLGVSNINGVLQWHCFKASCVAHGVYEDGMSLDGIKNKLNNVERDITLGREIPYLVDFRSNVECVDFLKIYNGLDAAEQGLVTVKYSPTEHRIMFGVGDNRLTPVGYTGRRLNEYGPKWIKYGDTSKLFTCGFGPVGVLVEDAPSATAVGVIPEYTGISLLGTNLTPIHKLEIINKFTAVLVCLDPDAASKSFKLSKQLEGFISSSVRLIPDDLKYFKPNQIKQILEN